MSDFADDIASELVSEEEIIILLVDDRPENLVALEAVLEPLGHRTLSATSGEKALRHLLTTEVAVILLDVRMPGMDGYQTAQEIKQRERTRDIPILFLTAHAGDAALAVQGLESGAVDFVTKPFEPDLLRAKVQVFVDLSLKTRLLRRQSEILAARLDQRYAAEARHLRKLADAAVAINSTLALDEMLKIVNQSAREIIGAHGAETVILADGQTGGERSRSYSAKYEGWIREGRHVDLAPVYKTVWERNEPVRMTKREIGSSLVARGLFEVTPGHPLLEGWLAVPLRGRTGRILGLIQVADKVEGDFTESDEVVLLQLAQLAAVAVENAEQYEQEHQIAETLQRSLLPDVLPTAPGVRIAVRYLAGGAGAQVGGDWYDVVPLEDGRVALSVGDVVGRGARAAAVMGQLRTAMRAYSLLGLPSTSLMVSLDRLLQDLHESSIATVAYLVVDPTAGQAECLIAGHPPPVILRPGEKPELVRCDPHTPLGALAAPVYTPSILKVPPGSVLLLYTDGLVEQRRVPLDEGLRRLIAAINPAETDLERLCDHVLSAMVDGETDDDIALLAARLVFD